MVDIVSMAFRHLKDELDVLRAHLEQDQPDPEFILLHARAILSAAQSDVEQWQDQSSSSGKGKLPPRFR